MREEFAELGRELSSRPAVWLLLGLATGLTFNFQPLHLLAGAMVLLLPKPTCRWLLLGGLLLGLFLAPKEGILLTEPMRVKGVGFIDSTITTNLDQVQFIIRNGDNRYLVSTEAKNTFRLGDQVRYSLFVRPLAKPQGWPRLSGAAFAEQPDLVVLNSDGVTEFGWHWRQSIRNFLAMNLDPSSLGLVEAMVFGADNLGSVQKAELKSSGIYRVVSSGGLVVGLIWVSTFGGLRRFPVPRSLQLLSFLGIGALYVTASGLHPGSVRALLFAALMGSAYLFRRTPDAISALCISSALMLLGRPIWIFDLGFQLSAAIQFTLVLWMSRSSNKADFAAKITHGLMGMALASFIAFALLGSAAHEVQPLSGFASLLVLPLVPIVVAVCFTSWALSFWWPAMAGMIVTSIGLPVVGWVHLISQWFGRKDLSIAVPAFSGYGFIPLFLLILAGARNYAIRGRN